MRQGRIRDTVRQDVAPNTSQVLFTNHTVREASAATEQGEIKLRLAKGPSTNITDDPDEDDDALLKLVWGAPLVRANTKRGSEESTADGEDTGTGEKSAKVPKQSPTSPTPKRPKPKPISDKNPSKKAKADNSKATAKVVADMQKSLIDFGEFEAEVLGCVDGVPALESRLPKFRKSAQAISDKLQALLAKAKAADTGDSHEIVKRCSSAHRRLSQFIDIVETPGNADLAAACLASMQALRSVEMELPEMEMEMQLPEVWSVMLLHWVARSHLAKSEPAKAAMMFSLNPTVQPDTEVCLLKLVKEPTSQVKARQDFVSCLLSMSRAQERTSTSL